MQLPTRRQLTLLLVLLASSFSFSQTRATITGNVTSITGVTATSGIVQFTLAPFSTAIQYRVNGVSTLDPIIAQCSIDSSGNIKDQAGTGACLLWGNDNITPANTCYQVGFDTNGQGYNRVLQGVQITGAAVDLASPTFCPSIRVSPEQVAVSTDALSGNIVPSADNFFVVGGPQNRYNHGYFTNLDMIGGTFTITGGSCVGCGVGTVTASSPVASSGGLTPNISIANAAADGTTKGAAAFTAADFDAASGLISLDYTNAQAADGTHKGFLTSTDWTTFNGKGTGSLTNLATTSPITGGPITTTGTIACTTCVTASVPGAGIARFPGGSQAVTSAELSGDVTTSASNATTVAKIQSTTVSGTTGSTNVVFSASPALTGVPTAPTAAISDNSTQLATTAFVQNYAPGGAGTVFLLGGDGSDGPITADGAATLTCLGAPAVTVYTMTRDCFFTTLTNNVGSTIITNNFAIFCTSTLSNAGSINNNGTIGNQGANALNATGANGGATIAAAGSSTAHYPRLVTSTAGTTGGSGAVGAGAQAAAANVGTNASAAVDSSGSSGASGSSGGAGGTGTSGAGGVLRAGATGGTVSNIAGTSGHTYFSASTGTYFATTTVTAFTSQNAGNGGAPGGGGGGGDGANSGGGGGGGGGEGGHAGIVGIFAKTISNSGTISSTGGTGGLGGNGRTQGAGNVGGGGGGAGGSGGKGGIVWLVAQSISNSGTISAAGGTHGNGGTKGNPAGTGTNDATNGSNGPDGPAGIVIQIKL